MQDWAYAWVAAATGLILLIPVAMQLAGSADWGVFDFVLIAALLFGAGAALVHMARRLTARRAIVGLVIVSALALLWVELAVGQFTNWGD